MELGAVLWKRALSGSERSTPQLGWEALGSSLWLLSPGVPDGDVLADVTISFHQWSSLKVMRWSGWGEWKLSLLGFTSTCSEGSWV